MKKLPDRIYVRWSCDGEILEAMTNYKGCLSYDEDRVVVGVYDFAHMQVVEKEITLSTRKVSRTGKIGRIP